MGEKAVPGLSSITFCHSGRAPGSEPSWAACSGLISTVCQPNTSATPLTSMSASELATSRTSSTVPAHPESTNDAVSKRTRLLVRINFGNILVRTAGRNRLSVGSNPGFMRKLKGIHLHLNDIMVSPLRPDLVERNLVCSSSFRRLAHRAEDIALKIGVEAVKRIAMLAFKQTQCLAVFFLIQQYARQPQSYKVFQLIFLAVVERPLQAAFRVLQVTAIETCPGRDKCRT